MRDDLITRREACEVLGISDAMVRKLTKQGHLRPVRTGAGRILYNADQVRTLAEVRVRGAGEVRADSTVVVDADRTPPAADDPTSETPLPAAPRPEDPTGRPLPPWRVQPNDEPVAVAADTTDKPANTATAEVDALDQARRQLDASWVRLRRERVALEHAAQHLARERAERDRQVWRNHRIVEVVDGLVMMLVASGLPMPMVVVIADQLGAWLGQLDDQALADDGVVASVIAGVIAMVVPPRTRLRR